MWLAALGLVGLLLRVLYAFTLSPPLPATGDDAFYYYTSNLIAQGNGYSAPETLLFTGHLVPTALHPPLWPAVLALFSLFTAPGSGVGMFGGFALDLHVVVGCACGGVVVALVGLLGRRIGGWRVGLVAAALAAVYPRFIVLDGFLSGETLFGALIGLLLLAAFDFCKRPTRLRALLLGVLVGLAALTREEGLLFVPVLLIPLAWRTGTDRRYLTILAVLGTVLVVAPWTARNYAVFGRAVPVANSGAVIAGSNCASAYYGSDIGSWQIGCIQPGHLSANEALVSDRERAQGISYASRHPARAVLVAAVRLLRVWSLFAPTDQAVGNITLLWIGTGLYYCLLAAAGYALWVRWRRGLPIMILISPAIVASIASILGDGPERLRYEAELPLLALAAWTGVNRSHWVVDSARRMLRRAASRAGPKVRTR